MKPAILLAGFLALLLSANVGMGHKLSHAPTAAEVQTDDPDAWEAYKAATARRLEASTDPRDWAVAAVAFHTYVPVDRNGAGEEALRIALLRRATAAAPDDVLTQWAVLVGSRFNRANEPYTQALDQLKRIDAENAAVWLEAMVGAAAENDRNAVTAALHRMATSSTFTNHLADLSDLVVRAYSKSPIPQKLIDGAARECPDCAIRPATAIPLLAEEATMGAIALPAFQFVMNVCDTVSGKNADRADDCRAVGRLLAARGDSYIATRIGFAALRVSRTFTDEDVAHAREADWIFQKYSTDAVPPIDRALERYDVDRALTFQSDWLQTGSELGALRKGVERAAVPVVPAANWEDDNSPFSQERLKKDETRKAFAY